MSFLRKELLRINDRVFILKKILKEELCIDTLDPQSTRIDLLKQWLDSDIVFRKDGLMYFCETIEDLEIIQEEDQQELITEKIEKTDE